MASTSDFMTIVSKITKKLLKLRLPLHREYGFLYYVSCEHWKTETGRKIYKFGITSQDLTRRLLFYDAGNFGKLTLFHFYACTNAKKVEDALKLRVTPHVAKGREWVELEP